MSSANSLPSGTYVIHSVEDPKKDERLIMTVDPDGSGDPVKTEKDKLYKWIVTYYDSDKNYTIQAADQDFFAVTKKATVHLKNKVETVVSVRYSSAFQRFSSHLSKYSLLRDYNHRLRYRCLSVRRRWYPGEGCSRTQGARHKCSLGL